MPFTRSTSTTGSRKTKKSVFHKLLSGICNPSKVVNHVVVSEPNAHMRNHHGHSSSFLQEMETNVHSGSSMDTIHDTSSPSELVAEHELLGAPLSSSSLSSLQPKTVIPLVRRVSFQDQSSFNTSYRRASNSHGTMTMMSAPFQMSHTDETPSPLAMKQTLRRLTVTNVLVMTVLSLLVLFIAAVLGTTTTTTDGVSALFVSVPTRVAPVLPSTTVSSTIGTEEAVSIRLATTTMALSNSTIANNNNNSSSSSLVRDERQDAPLPVQQQLPLNYIPTESVTAIGNGTDAPMGMENDAPNASVVGTEPLPFDDDDDDSMKELELGLQDAKTIQPPHFVENVVRVVVDDMVSLSELDKMDRVHGDLVMSEEGNDASTGESILQQGAEQEVDEASEDEKRASSRSQEGESLFTNPESAEHMDEEHVADDAFSKEASDVGDDESHIAQVIEFRSEERVSDDIIKDESKIQDESVIISEGIAQVSELRNVERVSDDIIEEILSETVIITEELIAEQQVEEGRASDAAIADATLAEKESAAVEDLEMGKSGKERVGGKPDLQDWIVYSNITMAIAFSMSIVASWIDNRKAPAADSTRNQWQ